MLNESDTNTFFQFVFAPFLHSPPFSLSTVHSGKGNGLRARGGAEVVVEPHPARVERVADSTATGAATEPNIRRGYKAIGTRRAYAESGTSGGCARRVAQPSVAIAAECYSSDLFVTTLERVVFEIEFLADELELPLGCADPVLKLFGANDLGGCLASLRASRCKSLLPLTLFT